MVEIVQNLNCWLKFCIYTSSIGRGVGGVTDIAAEKELHQYYWQPYNTRFLLSQGVTDKRANFHFSQFWAKCLIFLETEMPQMYFNTEGKNCFVIIPSLLCQFSCYIIIRGKKREIYFEKLIFSLGLKENQATHQLAFWKRFLGVFLSVKLRSEVLID